MRAVLIVDMLKDFIYENGALFCGRRAFEIVPRVRELSKEGRVFFICDSHKEDDPEFRLFPRHCVEGTWGAEIIDELKGIEGEVVKKRRFSGFFGTDLDERLKEGGFSELIVCGVCTDICVLFTVADARNRDYDVLVYRDSVASFDEEGHNFALRHMDRVLGAKVL